MLTTEEKLKNIESDTDWNEKWSDKLDRIKENMQQVEIAKKKNIQEAERLLNDILETYWNVFHTHNTYEKTNGSLPSKEYEVGIFLVGFSSLPIALSLAEIEPKEAIYFLYSRETERMLTEISNRIETIFSNSDFSKLVKYSAEVSSEFALKIINSADPVSTFKLIKEIIDKVGDKKIALDLTGGKKTMLGGGFTAGSILAVEGSDSLSACDMFYVDSLKYDSASRSPEPGTEFLSQLKNPYDIYNIQSVQQAEKLFENHNYEAAAVLLDSVDKKLDSYAKRYGLENEHKIIRKDLYIADCYSYWDSFDYIAAKASKKKYGTFWDYNTRHTYDSTFTKIDVLDILSKVEDPKTLFFHEATIIHYAVDRWENGIRRMESDRFDDATVRFTQVIEILCRYHVYKIAVDNCLLDKNKDYVSVSLECCLDEEWSITKLIGFLFNSHQTYDRRYSIGNEIWRLDKNNYDFKKTKEVNKLIKPRNDFVHVKTNPGWEDMKDSAENLQNLACTFLKNFSHEYRCQIDLSFNELLNLHKFRQ